MHSLSDQVLKRLLRHHPIRRYIPLLHFITVKNRIAPHIAQTGNRFDQIVCNGILSQVISFCTYTNGSAVKSAACICIFITFTVVIYTSFPENANPELS